MQHEDRYARHRLIEWWDQDRLRAARVVVVGAGAIGNEVIKLLALTGVGHLAIVDSDRIETSNLSRSVLFREQDAGRAKAETAAERAREIDPSIDARPIVGDLEYDVGKGVYRAADLVIGCLDSIGGRLALNRICMQVGTPWLNGGIEAILAEVALYGGQGACYECGISETMWARQSERFSCTGLRRDSETGPVPTTAIVASITAGYLVNEALFLLHSETEGEKSGLSDGQKLYFTFKPYSTFLIDLPYNPHCLAHEKWEPVEVIFRSPSEITLAGMLAELEAPDGVLELGFDLLTSMRCVRCGEVEEMLRPLDRCGENLQRCASCAADTRQPETIQWLDGGSTLANRTLAELGIPDYQILAVKYSEGRHFIQLTGTCR